MGAHPRTDLGWPGFSAQGERAYMNREDATVRNSSCKEPTEHLLQQRVLTAEEQKVKHILFFASIRNRNARIFVAVNFH
jgi:hypothetical protein